MKMATDMRSLSRQKGAVIVTTALGMLFLLAFMAAALDFGHLFVVKNELQSSMDACALAAVQELDGASDSITRAIAAGKSAGNLNNVNFQSATWSGQGKIVDGDITFKDSAYGTTATASAARYAQCQHTQGGIKMWLLSAMGAVAGSTDPAFSNDQSVSALAVATRAPGQSACPVPIGLRRKTGGVAPDYGYVVGEWVVVKGNTGSGPGQAGWFSLDPDCTGATCLVAQMSEPGLCGLSITDPIGTEVPGAKNNLESAWNARFGIYKNITDTADGVASQRPDYTGYAYTSTNWPNASPQNAYDGTPTSNPTGTAENFTIKRAKFASYDDTGTDLRHADDTVSNGGIYDRSPGINTGGFRDVATPGNAGQHKQYGYSRRLVIVPLIPPTGAGVVDDFACMLMLQPMVQPTDDVNMEYRGNAKDPASPCGTRGSPGGAGALVPVLVQ